MPNHLATATRGAAGVVAEVGNLKSAAAVSAMCTRVHASAASGRAAAVIGASETAPNATATGPSGIGIATETATATVTHAPSGNTAAGANAVTSEANEASATGGDKGERAAGQCKCEDSPGMVGTGGMGCGVLA